MLNNNFENLNINNKKEIVGNKENDFLEYIKQKLSSFEESFAQRERDHDLNNKIESGLENFKKDEELFTRYLNRFSDYAGEVKFLSEDIAHIQADKNEFDLPDDYALKGGAARIILESTLGVDGLEKPRDIDICFVGEDEDLDLSYEIAEKYCPEDLLHGHGVEKLEDDYFYSRDFTLNEILVRANDIILSKQCLLDTLRGVVRFSDFEKESWCGEDELGVWNVNDKLASKALRFIAEKKDIRDLDFIDNDFFNHKYIDEFHIALHLDRALGMSYEIALDFINELKKYEQLPEDIDTPEECIHYLEDYTDFIFRYESSAFVHNNDDSSLENFSLFEKEYGEVFEKNWKAEESY